MQAVLNAHFHLDGGVELGVGAQSVHNDVHLLDHVVQPAAHGGTEEIPAGTVTVPSHQGHTGTAGTAWLGLHTKQILHSRYYTDPCKELKRV